MALFGKKVPQEKSEDITKAELSKQEIVSEKKSDKKIASKTTKAKKEKVVKGDLEKTDTTGGVKTKSDYSYRITEKSTSLSDKNVYVLNVPKTTNKTIIIKDLQDKYKVKVVSINIVNSPKKTKMYRGKMGSRGGGKKAYITLKAGDSIVL